mmetsp:Transcript_133520/g.302870  ORF Transcript_133520/g.302870 Transcript_133520/m.302870 type:complete len:260 (+) Transcript_133520:94-873(+)
MHSRENWRRLSRYCSGLYHHFSKRTFSSRMPKANTPSTKLSIISGGPHRYTTVLRRSAPRIFAISWTWATEMRSRAVLAAASPVQKSEVVTPELASNSISLLKANSTSVRALYINATLFGLEDASAAALAMESNGLIPMPPAIRSSRSASASMPSSHCQVPPDFTSTTSPTCDSWHTQAAGGCADSFTAIVSLGNSFGRELMEYPPTVSNDGIIKSTQLPGLKEKLGSAISKPRNTVVGVILRRSIILAFETPSSPSTA